jgi:hypothetical protein
MSTVHIKCDGVSKFFGKMLGVNLNEKLQDSFLAEV